MAVHRAIGTRDPYSYPRLECDDTFVGKRATQVKQQFDYYSHLQFGQSIIQTCLFKFKRLFYRINISIFGFVMVIHVKVNKYTYCK